MSYKFSFPEFEALILENYSKGKSPNEISDLCKKEAIKKNRFYCDKFYRDRKPLASYRNPFAPCAATVIRFLRERELFAPPVPFKKRKACLSPTKKRMSRPFDMGGPRNSWLIWTPQEQAAEFHLF